MLTLSVKTVTAAYIALSYQVTNTETTDIYVADLLYQPAADGSLSIDPRTAYVMPQADGTLYTGKLIMRIPDGMKVESPELPYFQRLGPGETISGEIVLTNPAKAYHPYDSYRLGETPQAVARIVFQIGVIRGSDLKPGEATLSPAPQVGPGYFKPDYGFGLEYQVTEQAEAAALPPGASFFPVEAIER